MRRGFRRVATALLGAGALAFAVLAPATSASAGAPVTTDWDFQYLDCVADAAPDDALVFTIWTGDGGVEAALYAPGADPYVGMQAQATLGAATFGAAVDMYKQSEAPDGPIVGTVSVVGTYAADGALQVVDERTRSGNRWTIVTGTRQSLAGQAEVTAATGALAAFVGTDLTCTGMIEDLVLTGSNPTTTVFTTSGGSAKCVIGDGFLSLYSAGRDTYAELVQGTADPQQPPTMVAAGPYTLVRDSITGTLPVVEPPGDSRVASIDLTIGAVIGRGHDTTVRDDITSRVNWVDHALTGTVTLPDGVVVPLPADCTYQTFKEVTRGSFPPNPLG